MLKFVEKGTMVSVEEAFKKIGEITSCLSIVEMELKDATGFVLAEDYVSKISFPPFDQSAMDGYAINSSGNLTEFNVITELKAGDSGENVELKSGEACRIFTGAMLPKNVFAIVKQEDVLRNENTIQLFKPLEKGENVRLTGEQIKAGEIAVKKHTVLNPGAIGFLSTLGIKYVRVFRKPKITIIATGNELVEAGGELKMGEIFESNSNTLLSALQVYGFKADTAVVKDSYDLIRDKIEDAIASNDVVLITGGISVGDYDFVGKILGDLKVEEIFYKVKQKPGKPLFFGVKGNTIIFALPGNPAAVLTSFYVYVLHALAQLTGRKTQFLTQKKLKLSENFEKSPNLTLFLKGKIINEVVSILPAQSSAMLSSFIEANCLIKMEELRTSWKTNDLVEVWLIE